MRNVAAEQVPTVVTSDGPNATNVGKGEFVTSEALVKDKTWIQTRITTDDSTEATGVLPAIPIAKRQATMVFPETKALPRVGHLFLDHSNEKLTRLW
jgi:hypothetical protein